MSIELRAAFAELAQTCAVLRRCAEAYYDRSGDYRLITATDALSRIGQRLEGIALDRLTRCGVSHEYD